MASSEAPERAGARAEATVQDELRPARGPDDGGDHGRWCASTPAAHRRAFEALFEQHHARIYDFIARMIDDPAEADDLTQDVFLKAYRKLPETVARGDFRPVPWLYRIATNRCIDLLRRRRLVGWCSLDRLLPWRPWHPPRGKTWVLEPAGAYLWSRPTAVSSAEGVEVADPTGSGDPQRQVLEHERAVDVQTALGRLRPSYRTVLLLREYRQLSYDEIAEVISSTRSGVKSLLYRARGEFRLVWPHVSPGVEDAGERDSPGPGGATAGTACAEPGALAPAGGRRGHPPRGRANP